MNIVWAVEQLGANLKAQAGEIEGAITRINGLVDRLVQE